MKIKTRYIFPALMLCIGAFFTPVPAFAAGASDMDTTPPTVSAEVKDGTLHIEASDDDSGVDAVYIGEKRVNYRVDGAIDLDFADFVKDGQETVGIYAVDFAGNQSRVVNVRNPGYQTPAAEPEQKPLTPDGQASVLDNATDVEGKEFYTFTTPDENIFYLVIDRQQDSENVYFLNAVTEADLMALAEKDQEGPSQSAVPDPAPVCSCAQKCVPGGVNAVCPVCVLSWQGCTATAEAPGQTNPEPEKPQDSGGTGTVIVVLMAALAVGGAGWYIKIYKPKHDLSDAEDLDELTGAGEEHTVNEDDLPEPRAYGDEPSEPRSYEDESYEPNYPEDYGGDRGL